LLDPKFRRSYGQYLFQAVLATTAMAVILLFVDSLSSAAIAAGLGSSVVGIFINPTGATARLRAVVGGHTMALLLGSVFSFILFAGSIETFVADHSQFHVVMMALSVGLLILVMAITDTEHPPAAGIAIGMASREWTPEVFGAILGALVLLGVIKLVLRRHLRDLL
jgi:CBS-domain-containing membrane protein